MNYSSIYIYSSFLKSEIMHKVVGLAFPNAFATTMNRYYISPRGAIIALVLEHS